MSIEDNNTEENQNQPAENTGAADIAQSATEAASATAEAGKNAVASFLALKESNPKVFYGGVGAVVLVIVGLMFSGGDDKKLPVHQAKPIVPGQSYVLKSPNTYDPNATIRLVSVPGSMAAYDDTEENDREGACKHMPQNTPVKLIQSQPDSSDKNVVWVEVEMAAAGECQGKRAWTSAINLQ